MHVTAKWYYRSQDVTPLSPKALSSIEHHPNHDIFLSEAKDGNDVQSILKHVIILFSYGDDKELIDAGGLDKNDLFLCRYRFMPTLFKVAKLKAGEVSSLIAKAAAKTIEKEKRLLGVIESNTSSSSSSSNVNRRVMDSDAQSTGGSVNTSSVNGDSGTNKFKRTSWNSSSASVVDTSQSVNKRSRGNSGTASASNDDAMSIESSTALTSKAVTTTRSGRQTGLKSSSSAATFESSTSYTADTVTKAEASKVENNRATTNDDFEPPLRPRVLALSGNKGTTTGTTGTGSAAAVKPTLSRSSNTRAAVDTRSQSPERGTTDRFGKADDTEIEPESPRTQELSYFLRTQVGSNEHKPPRVGSNFQVNIDEFVLTPAATDMHSESGYIQTRSSSDVSANDGLVWQPEAVSEEYLATYVMAVDDCVSEVKESFLRRKSSDSLKPCKDGQIFINGSYVLMKSRLEDLHYDTLHQCEYKADDAVELLSALQDEIFVEWTHQEQAIFRSLFNKYGDNLYKIADSLENKTRNDVIEYFFRSIYSAVQLEDVNLESFVPDMSTLLGPLSPSEDSAKPNESSALATSGASNMQSESEGVRQSAFGKDTMDLGLDELNVAKSSHDTGSHNGLMPGSNRPDAKKQSEIDSESDDESESEQAAVDSVDKVNSLRLREVGGDEKTNSQLKDVETTDADANIDSKRAPKKSKLKFVDGQPPNSFKPSHDDDNDDGNDNNHPDNGNARKGTTSTAGNNIPIHFQNSSGQQQQSTQQSSHAVSGNKTSDLGTSAPNSLKSIGESLQKQKQKQKQQSLEALRRSSVRFKSPAQTFMPLSRLREPSITTQEDNSTSTEGGMTTASDSMKALVEVEQVGSLTASESATWSKNTIKTEVTPSIYEQSSITEELTTTSESFESSVDLNLNSAQDTVTTASTADTDLSVLPVVEPVQPPISTVAQEHTIDRVSDVKETAVSQIYLPPLPVQAPRSFVVGYSSWHGNVEASLVPIKPPGPVKPAGPPTGVLYPTSASGSSKMYYNASVGDTSGSFQSSYLNDFSKGDDPSRIGGTYMIQKKNLNGSVYSTTPNSIGAYNAASFASSIEPNRQYQIPIDLSAYPVTSTMPYRDNPYSKMSNEHLRSINAINKLRLLNRKVEQNKSGISEFTTTKPKKSTVASNSLKASQNMLRLNLGSEESSKLLDKIKNIGRTTVSDKVALEYNSITASTKKRSYVKSENYSKGKILSSHQGSMTESQLNNASQHSKLKPKKQGNASTGNPYQCKSHDSGQNAPIRRGRPLGSGRKAPVIAKSLVSNSTKMKMDRNNVMVFLTRTRDYLKESNYAQIINTFIMFGDHVLEPTQLCIRMHAIIHRSFGYHLQFHFQHSKSYAILKRIEKSKKQMTELYKLLTLLFPIPLRPFICKMLVLN